MRHKVSIMACCKVHRFAYCRWCIWWDGQCEIVSAEVMISVEGFARILTSAYSSISDRGRKPTMAGLAFGVSLRCSMKKLWQSSDSELLP